MKLNLYHKVILLLTVPVFGFFIVFYGYEFYATVIEKNGFWGHRFEYYDISKLQFIVYKLIKVLLLSSFIIFQILFFKIKNTKSLHRTYLIMLLFTVCWILFELYLQTLFIGKG